MIQECYMSNAKGYEPIYDITIIYYLLFIIYFLFYNLYLFFNISLIYYFVNEIILCMI
jgi:hypothetical protein